MLLITLLFPLAVYIYADGTIPDQVHLSFTGDMTEMGVVWNTFEPVTYDVEYYKKNEPSTKHVIKSNSHKWIYHDIVRYSHRAIMTDLDEKTEYVYRIGTRQFHFKTMARDPSTYKVCVFGDLGYWHGNSTDSIIKHGLAGDFDFIVHLGDIAYDLHADDGRVGDKYLNTFEPLLSTMPYMVIAGNHEDDRANFTNYQNRFMMPNNGFSDNQFYSFDLGPVHWVGVSTENYGFYYDYGMEPVFTQYHWLENDFMKARENKNIPWIFTYQHRPFYCSNVNSGECQSFENRIIRTGWLDMKGLESLFQKYSIDFGFWGHEHSYERMYPVADRHYYNTPDAYNNPLAPVYVISGSAGCHTPDAKFSTDPWPWSAVRNNDYGWSLLTVANKTHIRFQQISIENNDQPVDDFWVTKDPDHRHSDQLRVINPGTAFPKMKCHFKDIACLMTLKQLNEEL